MNITMEVSTSDLNAMVSGIDSMFDELKPKVQSAMAESFHGIVISNLGPTGIDRPLPWAPLSNHAPYFYAQKVGRAYATLYETGLLASSISFNGDNPDAATVYVDDGICAYAARHQNGSGNLPARPFFPISKDGEVTSYTNDEMVKVAGLALAEELQ